MNRLSLAVSFGVLLIGSGAPVAAQPAAAECRSQPEVKPKAEALIKRIIAFDKAGKGELGLFEAVESLGYDLPRKAADVLKKRGKLVFTRTPPGAGDFDNASAEAKMNWLFDGHIPARVGGGHTVTDQAMALTFKQDAAPYVKNLVFEMHLVAVKVTPERIDVTASSAGFSQCIVFK